MDIITSKATVQTLVAEAIHLRDTEGEDAFMHYLHTSILRKKIRFPLLEYAAKELYKAIAQSEQLVTTDKIIALHEIGGNVLAAIILQHRLGSHFKKSIDKAAEYIITGNEWYVCDIIGERVMGYALLTMPEETIPVLRSFAGNEDKWIVRCIGVAVHYAIKKGLLKVHVDKVFGLLLSLSSTTEFHTKKGIGWAAKTTAKFHPEIIEKYKDEIAAQQTREWFKTKVKIGLGRTAKYDHRYTS
jgi:3-methyladenine DNA glycosylase AlkD